MGFRTQEEEGALDGMSLDEYLVENKEATFMLRMRGSGMRDSMIEDGDLLIVDRSREPGPNDIVIAVIDGGFAVRPMRVLSKFQINQSAAGDLRIEAVVTAVIRKF